MSVRVVLGRGCVVVCSGWPHTGVMCFADSDRAAFFLPSASSQNTRLPPPTNPTHTHTQAPEARDRVAACEKRRDDEQRRREAPSQTACKPLFPVRPTPPHLENMAPQPPPATWAALAQHPRLYEMLGSVLVRMALACSGPFPLALGLSLTSPPLTFPANEKQMGVALGLVLLLVLSAFPGEPFDYSKPDGGRAEREHVQRTAAPVEKEEPVRAGGGDKATTRTTTLRQRGGGGGRGAIPEAPSDVHQDDEAEALHRLLGQEDRLWQQYQRLPVALRRLLGLSEERVRKAARETRRQATAAGGGGRGEEGKAGKRRL